MNTVSTDKLVMELFEKVAEKKKEIEFISRPHWKTSCSFGYDASRGDNRKNIQVITNINELVDIYAFLVNYEKSVQIASKELGVKVHNKWMGYDVDEWKEDIKLRISIINVNSKKKELESLEVRLNALVSPDQRRALEIAEIQKLLL